MTGQNGDKQNGDIQNGDKQNGDKQNGDKSSCVTVSVSSLTKLSPCDIPVDKFAPRVAVSSAISKFVYFVFVLLLSSLCVLCICDSEVRKDIILVIYSFFLYCVYIN